MKRKIIKIDEERCNGCGECITACHEGALALVDGKARLVKESYCDGLGDCIGECPVGAITMEEREAPPFEEQAANTAAASTPQPQHTCPGHAARTFNRKSSTPASTTPGAPVIPSELQHWPVQLHLVPPGAPFLKNRELVLLSTCAPVACPDVHGRFIRGRSVLVACPKLDRQDGYVEKLAEILADPTIPAIYIVRMEVPCCGGLTQLVAKAMQINQRTDLAINEVVITLDGCISEIRTR
jgi:ferredoxin